LTYRVKKEHKGKEYISEREGIVSKYWKKIGRATFIIHHSTGKNWPIHSKFKTIQ
jgi:hypothetical protein